MLPQAAHRPRTIDGQPATTAAELLAAVRAESATLQRQLSADLRQIYATTPNLIGNFGPLAEVADLRQPAPAAGVAPQLDLLDINWGDTLGTQRTRQDGTLAPPPLPTRATAPAPRLGQPRSAAEARDELRAMRAEVQSLRRTLSV